MSQENVEIARQLYPGSIDLVATFEDPEVLDATRLVYEPLVHSDFEIISAPGAIAMGGAGAENPSQPIYRGMDGFVALFRDWLNAWESWMITPTDFIDVDENRVLVLADVLAREKRHQVEMPFEGANLLTLRDGRLARLEFYLNHESALEAAGLSE